MAKEKAKTAQRGKVTVGADELKERLEKLIPFMSTDECRPYLCSVFMRLSGESFVLVATNGHILCEIRIDSEGAEGEFAAICSAHDVRILIAMIDEYAGEVTVEVSEGRFSFAQGDKRLETKPLDGEYPEYLKVIPIDKPIAKQGFAADYLLSILNALGGHPVDIAIGDPQPNRPGNPHLFVSDKAQGIRCVAMPKLISDPY